MRIVLTLITVLALFALDDDMFDVADIKCRRIKPAPIGYPVRICSITFDDKGIIGKLLR